MLAKAARAPAGEVPETNTPKITPNTCASPPEKNISLGEAFLGASVMAAREGNKGRDPLLAGTCAVGRGSAAAAICKIQDYGDDVSGWLLLEAQLHSRVIGKVMAILEAEEVFCATDLARLARLSRFDDVLKAVTAAKIRDALSRVAEQSQSSASERRCGWGIESEALRGGLAGSRSAQC